MVTRSGAVAPAPPPTASVSDSASRNCVICFSARAISAFTTSSSANAVRIVSTAAAVAPGATVSASSRNNATTRSALIRVTP